MVGVIGHLIGFGDIGLHYFVNNNKFYPLITIHYFVGKDFSNNVGYFVHHPLHWAKSIFGLGLESLKWY
jgi:hypothetical protein